MSARWADVNAVVTEFRRYLSTDFPSLQVTPLYDFNWSQEEYKASREVSAYNSPGVYLFYNESGELLYIGKASWTFDKRVWKHPEIVDARHIDVIAFDWPTSHFCLALEYFLIAKLNPRYNKQGREYGYIE